MAEADPLRTIISTKGQLILPKVIRDRRHWPAGTRLTVTETAEGVLLKPERLFPRTTLDEVAGCLRPFYDGPAMSIEEMDRAMDDEVQDRRCARSILTSSFGS